MTRRERGRRLLIGAAIAAVALPALELAAGGAGHGASAVRDPCGSRPQVPGDSTDARAQRFVIGGLDGAACRLGIGREDLVLAFGRRQRLEDVPGGKDRAEKALREGFAEAVGEAQERDDLNAIEAFVLRQVVGNVPLDRLIDAIQELEGRL